MASIHGQKCLCGNFGNQIEGWKTQVQPKTKESCSEKSCPYPRGKLAECGFSCRLKAVPFSFGLGLSLSAPAIKGPGSYTHQYSWWETHQPEGPESVLLFQLQVQSTMVQSHPWLLWGPIVPVFTPGIKPTGPRCTPENGYKPAVLQSQSQFSLFRGPLRDLVEAHSGTWQKPHPSASLGTGLLSVHPAVLDYGPESSSFQLGTQQEQHSLPPPTDLATAPTPLTCDHRGNPSRRSLSDTNQYAKRVCFFKWTNINVGYIDNEKIRQTWHHERKLIKLW